MGVPKFFSWITKRYPLILQQTQQGSLPDIDYLYLDMNGIIYKCSKDESIIFKSMVMSKQMEEIWLSIFNYISNIVDIIQPKKLLFLGLDGVAPRAKMNNQRSRRYNSAKSYAAMEERLNDYGEKNEQNFKNNCITPGTEFMFELNKQLRFFIQKKIQEDPEWQKFRVIFSGGDVPGEGEHKIMDFMREGVHQKIFDEESKHCLYGADADLIMLAMSLPIKNLCIIREEFIFNKNSKAINISSTKNNIEATFQLIYINILKEYFQLQYKQYKQAMKHEYNIQRIINDFVFLCFFIGNDFLPRCYCYDIREGHLQKLIEGFKQFLMNSETYLLGEQNINLIQLQRLTGILKRSEALFIASRQEQLKDLKSLSSESDKEKQLSETLAETTLEQPMKNEKQFLLVLKTLYMNDDLAGAKKHFYKTKFDLDAETNDDQITNIIEAYLTGLNYVYHYYFKTLPSWEWFYPYYYAPLVNDLYVYLIFKNQNRMKLESFALSQPYEPFKQLLCILPKQSYGLLPPCLQDLIKSEESPLRTPYDYFPSSVKIDPYGGKQEHQFISILPFIDQQLITKVYDAVDKNKFTQIQQERNIHTLNQLYIYDDKQPMKTVKSFYHYISDFKVSIDVHYLNFLKDSLEIVTLGIQKKIEKQTIYFDFPTLKLRQFDYELVNRQRQAKTALYMKLKLKETQYDKSIKLGSLVHFGFPNEKAGKVLAICTRTQLSSDAKDFFFSDFMESQSSKQPQLRDIWDFYDYEIASESEKKKGVSLQQTQVLYFLMISKGNVRKRSGKFIRNYEAPSYEIVSNCMVSHERKYSFTKIPFNPKSLEEEFLLNEQVVVLNKQFGGSVGKVVGYTNKKIRVQINKALNNIPKQVLQKAKGNDFFWSLGFVARLFNVDLDTILILMDSLPIQLNENNPSAKGMPLTIDIGLNYIKRQQKQLVPTLVRLPIQSQSYADFNLFKQFKKLEISTTALELMYKYFMKYPEIFYSLNQRTQRVRLINDWKEQIFVDDIWNLSDSSKKAIEVYLWLIKQEQVHQPNSNINSTMISKKKINGLLDYFKSKKNKTNPEIIEVDPNFLYSSRLAKQGLLYLKQAPCNHRIGDRVVCLHPRQFGQTAVVIGIDTEYNDLLFQVLFENPSFGKDNLGGLVDYLWGGEYYYSELFNIDWWSEDIQQRGKEDGKGWNGSPPAFVNSSVFKNTNNKRSQVLKEQNYQKVIDRLQLQEGLVQFIKKAAERNPGSGYLYATKRHQRYMNNIQKHEEVLLDPQHAKQHKPRYVEKETQQTKQEKVDKQVGGKVFQKFNFDADEQPHKTKYVQKVDPHQNPKKQTKPANVLQKIKYVEKKVEEKVEQKEEKQKEKLQKTLESRPQVVIQQKNSDQNEPVSNNICDYHHNQVTEKVHQHHQNKVIENVISDQAQNHQKLQESLTSKQQANQAQQANQQVKEHVLTSGVSPSEKQPHQLHEVPKTEETKKESQQEDGHPQQQIDEEIFG